MILSLLYLSVTLGLASTTTTTANFDDLTASPLESPTGIGVYEGLFYDAFTFSSAATLLVGGIEPHTPPIAILTTSAQQSTNGTPTITITYPGSTSSAFSLYSFWFGCAVHTDEAAAGVATQCEITVAGFQGVKEVAVASFTFTPPDLSVAAVSMIEAVVPAGFQGVQSVTVVQEDPTLQALIVDSVTFALQTS